MCAKRLGRQSLLIENPPGVLGSASIAGRKEGEGPLKRSFDYICRDAWFGEKSWEKAESAMLKKCFSTACEKAGIPPAELDCILSGDLLNQCAGSAYALRDTGVPCLGLYGACSTMAEALCLAALLIDGGAAEKVAALTSSHFCSAERQFRYPLEYGSVRTPSSQWTVTGAGAFILARGADAPYITRVTIGRILDAGITDTSNMGAAMAPAACDTLSAHFEDTGRGPDYYDAVITGDLGITGSALLKELMSAEGINLSAAHMDCGAVIYDAERQGVCSGGSGCGCSASVMAGYVLDNMRSGVWKRVLFAATGALMSPTVSQQGESIPGICHAMALEMEAC